MSGERGCGGGYGYGYDGYHGGYGYDDYHYGGYHGGYYQNPCKPCKRPPHVPKPDFCKGQVACITADREVQTSSADDCAGGYARACLDKRCKAMRVCLKVSGLTGAPTAASINVGAAGTDGPVVKDFELDEFEYPRRPGCGACEKFYSVCFNWCSNDDTQPLTGLLIDQFVEGLLYVQILTADNPNGEVRGQLLSYDMCDDGYGYGEGYH